MHVYANSVTVGPTSPCNIPESFCFRQFSSVRLVIMQNRLTAINTLVNRRMISFCIGRSIIITIFLLLDDYAQFILGQSCSQCDYNLSVYNATWRERIVWKNCTGTLIYDLLVCHQHLCDVRTLWTYYSGGSPCGCPNWMAIILDINMLWVDIHNSVNMFNI